MTDSISANGRPAALPLEELVAALARSPLFAAVELPQLRLLAFSAEERRYEAGVRIAGPDVVDAPAFLISAGRVRFDPARDARQEAGPGALINAAGAMSHAPLTYTITAHVDVRLLLITPQLVARLIGEYPEMGRAMLRSLGQDLRGLARQLRAETAAATSAAAGTALGAASNPQPGTGSR